jgi:hypothetical protein
MLTIESDNARQPFPNRLIVEQVNKPRHCKQDCEQGRADPRRVVADAKMRNLKYAVYERQNGPMQRIKRIRSQA